MSKHWLDICTQDSRRLQQGLITLDLTRMDFLSSTVDRSIALITSHLRSRTTCQILRPIYPQIVQIMIIEKPRDNHIFHMCCVIAELER